MGKKFKPGENYQRAKWSRDKKRQVYIIRHGDSNLYKIGCSTNLKERFKMLQFYNSKPLTISGNIKATMKFQKYLERKYVDYNVLNSIFEFPDDIIEEVLNLTMHKKEYSKERSRWKCA